MSQNVKTLRGNGLEQMYVYLRNPMVIWGPDSESATAGTKNFDSLVSM